MTKTIIQSILIGIVLLIVQILICNHIMLFNVATLFIFIYVIINLPLNFSTGWLLTWAFFSGLFVDICCDTLGVNALACIILAIIKRPIFYAYIPKDDRTKDIIPSISSLGFSVYAKYLMSMTAIYSVLVFSIEYMSIADIKEILIMSASSAVFTFIILLGLDSLLAEKHV